MYSTIAHGQPVSANVRHWEVRREMDKMVRFAIVAGALMAGTGVFYHYVFFLPGLERTKVERAEQTKRDLVAREAERKQTYDICLIAARHNYESNWATACVSDAQYRNSALKNCLTDKQIMSNQFMGASYCKKTYGDSDPSQNCTLPSPRASSINKTLKEEQEKCVTEAKLGLH